MGSSMVVKGYFSFVSKYLVKKKKIPDNHNKMLVNSGLWQYVFIFCAISFKLLKIKIEMGVGKLYMKYMLKWTYIPNRC